MIFPFFFFCIALIFLVKLTDLLKISALKNILWGFLLSGVLLLCLEIIFSFIPKSHSYADTLSSDLWYKKYWTQNSLHFRDQEPISDSQKDVFFIGDSFTAGTGIENTEHRFSNIWSKKTREKGIHVNTYNLGYEGLDSKMAYENALIRFISETNIQPELIVLQYFGNDIEYTAQKNGLEFSYKDIQQNNTRNLKKVIDKSYFLNYLYWYYLHKADFDNYFLFLENAFSNDKILMRHQSDLEKFVHFTNSRNISLIVIIMPFLNNLEWSENTYGKKINNFFGFHEVEVVNLCKNTAIKKLNLEERIIHKNDFHASKRLQVLIADEIFTKTIGFY